MNNMDINFVLHSFKIIAIYFISDPGRSLVIEGMVMLSFVANVHIINGKIYPIIFSASFTRQPLGFSSVELY